MIKFKGFEEVEFLIETKKRDLVVYKDDVFDLTDFKSSHPGGAEIIESYVGYDIEEAFSSYKIHKHSNFAHDKLKHLKIGSIDYSTSNND